MEKCGKFWKKWPFFRADMAGLGKYHTGGYYRIGVYRVKHHSNVRGSGVVTHRKYSYFRGLEVPFRCIFSALHFLSLTDNYAEHFNLVRFCSMHKASSITDSMKLV